MISLFGRYRQCVRVNLRRKLQVITLARGARQPSRPQRYFLSSLLFSLPRTCLNQLLHRRRYDQK
jgi:hypothetical protein